MIFIFGFEELIIHYAILNTNNHFHQKLLKISTKNTLFYCSSFFLFIVSSWKWSYFFWEWSYPIFHIYFNDTLDYVLIVNFWHRFLLWEGLQKANSRGRITKNIYNYTDLNHRVQQLALYVI